MRSTANGVLTNFVVDKNRPYAQVLEEKDDAGSLIVSYVYGDDLISQTRPSAGSGTVYYHYDGLGSTRALTDDAANVTDTYIYEAFGELLTSSGATENSYLFTGEQYDANIGFYYLRARYYNSEIGRFVSTDPFSGRASEPLSLHKYLYADGSPVNRIDPSGLATTLTELEAVQRILSKHIPRFYNYLTYVDKVRSLVGTYNTIRETLNLVCNNPQTLFATPKIYSFGGVSPGLANIFNTDFWLDALLNLQMNMGKIFASIVQSGTLGDVTKILRNKKPAFVIYTPTPIGKVPFPKMLPPVPSGIRLNVGGKKIPVKFLFGHSSGQGGQLLGVGVVPKAHTANGHYQLFRMDWHEPFPSATGNINHPNDFKYWESPPFHYHIGKKKYQQ